MDVRRIYDDLVAARQQIYSLWVEIEKFTVPFKGKFRSDEANPYLIYNDTVFRAANILKAGLYSYLTNPSSRWFTITTSSRNRSDKIAASEAGETLLGVLQNSNLYEVLEEFYYDLVIYGVSALYEEENPDGGVRFMCVSPKSFVFKKDVWGKVNIFIMNMRVSLNELVDRFGLQALSEALQKRFDAESWDKTDILFAVYKAPKGSEKPYESSWVEKETGNVIRKSGYDTFPVFVGQWDSKSGETYGSSPAINAYATILLANRITKSYWLNNEKLTNPPLDVPVDAYREDIDISPNAINWRTSADPNNRIFPIITTGNINVTVESIQDVEQEINEKFFVDLFLLGETPQMTATEVIQRSQEKMLLLGAVIGKLINRVLKPLIARTLGIAIVQGLIEKADYTGIEFLSVLAQSQKSSEYSSLVVLLNTVLQIAQIDAEVSDNINWDEFIRKVGEVYSIDAELFNSETVVQQMREQRAQLQQMQAQLELKEMEGKANKQQAQAELNLTKSQRLKWQT